MTGHAALEDFLAEWAGSVGDRLTVVATLTAIAKVGIEVADSIADGEIDGGMATVVGDGGGGDKQKALDLRAHDLFVSALKEAPVAFVGSEEAAEAIVFERRSATRRRH